MSPTSQLDKFAMKAGQEVRTSKLRLALLVAIDAGLAGCIFIVPLLMGGRQALGQFVLVVLAVAIALAWIVRQCLQQDFRWRLSYAEVLLVAGLVLLAVQLLPLPGPIVNRLTPKTGDILPLWGSQGDNAAGFDAWSSLSLTPARTRAAITILFAYSLIFLVTVNRIRRIEDVERLLRWIAFSALFMAGFGLLQLLAGNGKFFWFYQHPFTDTLGVAKGSFTNANHFAHFLALTVGPLLWWLQHKNNAQTSMLRALALGVVFFAGLLSLSRGGSVAIMAAAGVSVAVLFRAGRLQPRVVSGLATVGVLIVALLAVDGYQRVSGGLDDLAAGSIDAVDRRHGRRTIWAAVAKVVPDFPLLGAGAGSHREVYPMYMDKPAGTEYTHAECGPLQIAEETGLIGLGLVIAGIGLCSFWCIGGLRKAKSNRTMVCVGAVTASLVACVLHGLVDFVWYVPACMGLVAMLAACACGTYRLATGDGAVGLRRIVLPRPIALAIVPLLAMAGGWAVHNRFGPVVAEPHWHRYRMMEMVSSQPAGTILQQANTSDAGAETPDSPQQASLDAVNRMIVELEQVVRWQPDHARAHLRLAQAYIRRFDLVQRGAENAMPLLQVRDAAIASRFPTREALMQWLSVAIGDHRSDLELALRHTRRGLTLCPLQGGGYLHMAELCFLEGCGRSAKDAYIAQAIKVRPFDGAVLFEAGREAWLAGNGPAAMDCWQRAIRCDRKQQRRLVAVLAGRVPVDFILENFPPDLEGLRAMHYCYRRLDQPDQLEQVRRCYGEAARAEAGRLSGQAAADRWLEAQSMYSLLGENNSATQALKQALRWSPNNFDTRWKLAHCLIRQHKYTEARRHLDWCQQRRPEFAGLRRKMEEVVKKQIEIESRTVGAGKTTAIHR